MAGGTGNLEAGVPFGTANSIGELGAAVWWRGTKPSGRRGRDTATVVEWEEVVAGRWEEDEWSKFRQALPLLHRDEWRTLQGIR